MAVRQRLEETSRPELVGASRRMRQWSLRFIVQYPLPFAFLCLLVLVCLVAVLAPWVSPYSPTELVGAPLEGPTGSHLLGTDAFGRDLLSRMLYGARISLAVGFVASGAGIGLALIIGLFSAYAGTWIDYLLQRVVDVVQAIPALVFLLAIVVALGPALSTVIIALTVRSGIVLSRVVRGAALSLKEADYVLAAASLGAGHLRIMLRHIAPCLIPVCMVLFSVYVSVNIVAEAALSFLGFGVPPPTPSWGGMLSAHRLYMLSAPRLIIVPSAALALVILSTNIVADALQDRLDPKMRT